MEQRKHPRVQLPLLVELNHPALRRTRHLARDISQGGVFVHMQPPDSIKPGAKVRLTLLDPMSIDNQPSPTVELEVKRVEENGLGMAFVNKTSQHLWHSVERLREELQVGRDYFQVYQGALVTRESGQLLLVQQTGRWGFPGHYLVVGEQSKSALEVALASQLGLADARVEGIVDTYTQGTEEIPEAAVYRVFLRVSTSIAEPTLDADSTYSNYRWVGRHRDIEELTFGDEQLRTLARQLLDADSD